MNEEERRVRISEVTTYLDHLDRLLWAEPKTAGTAAAALPALVAGLDRDTQARAYACLGLAQVKSGAEAQALVSFARASELSREARAGIRALVSVRAISLAVRAGRYEEAERTLEEALELAERDPIDAVLGRIHLRRGDVAYRQDHYVAATERYGLAFNALPRDHYLRVAAVWNLAVTSYHVNGRDAHKVLRTMSELGLRCRRPRAPQMKRTVPGGIICWVEGCLHARAGHDKHAARCLLWAANSLHELGALREATLCALDLVALEPDGLTKVLHVAEALAKDVNSPKTVRDAAMTWVSSPAADGARLLRERLLEHGNAARQAE